MSAFRYPQRCKKCKEVMTVEPDGICQICKGTAAEHARRRGE